ncbi:hypothetical protein LIER_34196 [Lithospermum erythrorhizon]|uniref:Retrotransposon gag protein n=1 Tax=Lithospermum erythrorhizon TaxID=34254 RepID=A0AAV3S0P8_LITER
MTLRDYATPTLEGLTAHMLKPPPIHANNFQLHLGLVQHVKNHVQFSSLGHEDPNEHLINFMEVASTIKTPNEAYVFLEELSSNQHQSYNQRPTKRVVGVHEVDEKTKLEAQFASLTIQLKKETNKHGMQGSQSVVPLCTLCGGNQKTLYCPGGLTE